MNGEQFMVFVVLLNFSDSDSQYCMGKTTEDPLPGSTASKETTVSYIHLLTKNDRNNSNPCKSVFSKNLFLKTSTFFAKKEGSVNKVTDDLPLLKRTCNQEFEKEKA